MSPPPSPPVTLSGLSFVVTSTASGVGQNPFSSSFSPVVADNTLGATLNSDGTVTVPAGSYTVQLYNGSALGCGLTTPPYPTSTLPVIGVLVTTTDGDVVQPYMFSNSPANYTMKIVAF